MTDHIIKAAQEAGWTDLQIEMASPAERDRLARFWAIAHAAGMERAADICLAEQDHDEEKKADQRFKQALKDLKSQKATERNAVDRGDHWMCVATCNAVLRNAAKAIRSLKEQQHG